jgi:hypothetical protein
MMTAIQHPTPILLAVLLAAGSGHGASVAGEPRVSAAPAAAAAPNPNAALLAEYRESLRVPAKIYQRLDQWGALPPWAAAAARARSDWLASLHQAVTAKGWPAELRDATAGLVDHSAETEFAFDAVVGRARTVVIPAATPSYLQRLVEILNLALVPPDTADPQAHMLMDTRRLDAASQELARMVGMIGETGYSDGDVATWGGGVIMGTRFVYYHEMGHLSASLRPQSLPGWLLPAERYLADELLADQLAFAMVVLELRHARNLQPSGMAGMIFALGLEALREFADDSKGGDKRSTKDATLRVGRLLYWGKIAVAMGNLTQEALDLGTFYWQQLRDLLTRVQRIPSPVFSLLVQTADRPQADWMVARDHIAQWCAFGDRARVLRALRAIRQSAEAQAATEPRARRVLDVLAYVRRETETLEPELGLKAGLEQGP